MEKPPALNTDELIKQMQLDDLVDDISNTKYCTPVQYSKIRPVQAPQVYGWIRTGKLSWKRCDCGRKVINVQEADDLMRSKGRLPPIIERSNDSEEEPDSDTRS